MMRRWIATLGGVVAVLAVVAVAVLGMQGGAPAALDKAESLATSDGPVPSVAASYEPESLAQFEGVMHIEDGAGNALSLDDVPADDYSGFLFEIADITAGAGDVAALMAEAVDEGLVGQITDTLFTVDSLDTLAGLVSAEQVTLVEPDFTLHLVGDLDDDEGDADDAADANDAAGADDIAGVTIQNMAAQGGSGANVAPNWPPDDQYYLSGSLWNLDMLNVEGAWNAGLDGDPYIYNSSPVRDTPVTVAIIDTGLYGTGDSEEAHEDFNYDHISVGYDWINENAATAPDAKGHGTFVAGLIAAQANNGVGIAGAMPEVHLVSEKVFDTGSASTSDVISAIYHAAGYYENYQAAYGGQKAVDVINMSLGGEYNESTLEDACDWAVDHGVLVVASAGNDGVSTPNYPAAYDSVVGVASVNSSKVRSSWSQYGRSVFVTAPGESVTSTYIGASDSYHTGSGTSFSGPEVAALAAMCRSVYPDMMQDDFKQFLIDTSEDLGSAGYDDYYGYGLVDFEAMAAAVLDSQVQPWYNVDVKVVDEQGNAIDGATVEISAAEPIAWEANGEAEPSYEAGQLARGEEVAVGEDGLWHLHRGLYAYRITAEGRYMAAGTFKTYTVNQTVTVNMKVGYETTVNVVDKNGTALAEAELSVSPKADASRAELPKRAAAGTSVFDLASGAYTYTAELDGYEAAVGSFTVQPNSTPTFNVTLYKADELSTVSFSFVDDDTSEAVTGKVSLAVYDGGVAVAPAEDGTYRLARGKTYRAVATRAGYQSADVSFTVGADATDAQVIRMTKAQVVVTFLAVDESGKAVNGATVSISDANGTATSSTAAAGSNAVRFALEQGSYTYQASATGYESREGTVNVATDSYSLDVVLVAVPYTVTFTVTDEATGGVIDNPTIKVTTATSTRALPSIKPGVWSLTPGSYRYTVYASGYQVVQGDFQVVGANVSINIALREYASGAEFAGGSGTEDDPYLIETEAQLRSLANQTAVARLSGSNDSVKKKEYVTGYYLLVNDIALSDGEWLPIGNEENSSNYVRFAGTFDGGGHTVSNVNVNQPALSNQGFFGSVEGATIRNLVVQGSIVGDSSVGGLVGSAAYSHSSQYSSWNSPGAVTIEYCGSEMDVTGRFAVGGIIGSAQATDHDDDGQDYAVGKAGGITLEECYNAGNVVGMSNGSYDRANAIGGLLGSAQQVVVTSCYNAGTVDGGYNVGGLAGVSRRLAVSRAYNSGIVRQHNFSGVGYSETAGGLAGTMYYSKYTDCYFLSHDENTYNRAAGAPDSASIYPANATKSFDDMYRATAFVDMVNTDSATTPATVGTAFRLGRDFPLLVWQAGSDAVLAPAPRITVQPEGVGAANAYKVGDEAAALVAEVAEPDAVVVGGNALASTVTWAWYAASSADGADGVPTGATGAGLQATFTPPTDEVGAAYYYCVFTNTVSYDMRSDSASTSTATAAVYVRSVTDAQAPVITKLNPSASQDVVTRLAVKACMDLELSVTAEVSDGGLLSYQWYTSSVEGGEAKPIEDATSATYKVDSSVLGERYYYVVVTNLMEAGNEASTTSSWISVDVIPYTIETYEDLAAFATVVNAGVTFAGQTVYLTEDIEIPAGVKWTPIGRDTDHPFMGTFMGGTGYAGSDPSVITTHSITGIDVDGTALGGVDEDGKPLGGAYLGLFGYTLGASFYDVQVAGKVTGAANVAAGLLVGYANGSSSSGYDSAIENCATLPGSLVEGKYDIGGLAGMSAAAISNCANHATVHAYSFVSTTADNRLSSSSGRKAVGGVVGYAGAGVVSRSYNDGAVTVDDRGSNACASFAGGVAGYTGYYSGLYSCFNAGRVTIGSPAYSHYASSGVLWSGSVAGRVNGMRCGNVHYLEETYVAEDEAKNQGLVNEYNQDYADYHSDAFMATEYFVDMMNSGSSGYSTTQFTKSKSGAPHLCWETDTSVADDTPRSAEPWLVMVLSDDFPDITSTWKGTYFDSDTARPIYVLADSPDGGTLTFTWQKRAVPGDGGWEDIGTGALTKKRYNAVEHEASGFTVPLSAEAVGTMQYRCLVRNVAPDVDADAEEDKMESAIPAITITVRSSENVIALRDPSKANSADNPWVIERAEQLKFLADVVNGAETTLPSGLSDKSFTGQYVELAADIDLAQYADWNPIGGDNKGSFAGIFDGANHRVYNMTVATGTAYKNGLFGQIGDAVVRNLEVEGTVLSDSGTSGLWTGGIVGYAGNSFIENCVSRVDVHGYGCIGGIVGYAYNCKVLDCENAGTVSVNVGGRTSQYKGYDIGGVVGHFGYSAASLAAGAGVYNCYNSGQVTGCLWDLAYCTGAVVGRIDASSSEAVSNCYYVAGLAVSYDGSVEFAGYGRKVNEPVADMPGVTAKIESSNSPETAWLLATDGGTAGNSTRWGNYRRVDFDDAADAVHLNRGDAARALYRVDTASASADITVSAPYASAGSAVSVSWKAKRGYTLGDVSWVDEAGTEHLLGTGDASDDVTGVSFEMPASDVAFAVEALFEPTTLFDLTAAVVDADGKPLGASAGSVAFGADDASVSGADISFGIAVGDGYQVKSVTAADGYGVDVELARGTGWNYTFTMPTASVAVTVVLEPAGTPAEARAASKDVTYSALHRYSSGSDYFKADLLYDTVSFSGSYFGSEKVYMAYELESSTSSGLYEQEYSFGDDAVLAAASMGVAADGDSAHVFTGQSITSLILSLGNGAPADDTPVAFESADGTVAEYTWGELASLAYNSYDEGGAFEARGLPVLLYFGVDGQPNSNGAMGIVFGQTSPDDDNGARLVEHVTRIWVGDDVNYSQHVWGVYDDMDVISGGTTDAQQGYTTLTVRLYKGGDERGSALMDDAELIGAETITLPEIEALARADRAGIQHGFYSTYLYEDKDIASDGPYTDYYEGYDLYKVLLAAGVPETDEGWVQFYQTGIHGLDQSWKTVNVSLGYLAGNGPDGIGDYSGNTMSYAGDGVPSSGTLTGVRPMLVYGKNGYPLVWSSGTTGVSYLDYNYRGPMMAFLPQNADEGGAFVGSATATTCYLALMDVYLPESYFASDADMADLQAAIAAAQSAQAQGIQTSVDGTDIAKTAKWVTPAVAGELALALEAAQELAPQDDLTAEDVKQATARLEAATSTYLSSAKAGTKAESYVVPTTTIKVAKPTATSYTYTGAVLTGVRTGGGYTLSGTTQAKDVGTYDVTAKLQSGYAWTDGSTSDVKLTWSITAAPVTVYRLYHTTDGEHFYTTSREERDQILSWGGWNDEGVAWVVPSTSNTPVYRLYDRNTGEHHYTTSAEERAIVLSWGNWNDEGIAWYSDDAQTMPVHRLQNSSNYPHAHHYTLSDNERSRCINEWGWRSEGIGWYALAAG